MGILRWGHHAGDPAAGMWRWGPWGGVPVMVTRRFAPRPSATAWLGSVSPSPQRWRRVPVASRGPISAGARSGRGGGCLGWAPITPRCPRDGGAGLPRGSQRHPGGPGAHSPGRAGTRPLGQQRQGERGERDGGCWPPAEPGRSLPNPGPPLQGVTLPTRDLPLRPTLPPCPVPATASHPATPSLMSHPIPSLPPCPLPDIPYHK